MTNEEIEEIQEIIEVICPVSNFTKDMFDGFQMAKMSIQIELTKYFAQFSEIKIEDKDNGRW